MGLVLSDTLYLGTATPGSGGGSAVDSVNGKTGSVVLDATDVDAVPQVTTMPVASSSNSGLIVQFSGATDTYTNGYFYKNNATTTASSATASQTAGTSLTDVTVVVATFETQITTSGSYVFTSDGSDWSYDGNVVDLTDYGISYTGTPVADDAITVVYMAASTTYAWERIDVQPAQVNSDWNANSGVAQILNKPTIPDAIQVSSMPTAGADELGKVYQFIGTTDANYTHGYFYECVSDGQNPATYSWTAVQVQAESAPVVPATAPTLAVADWSGNTQTITVSGVTSSNVVLVGPAPASAQDYADAGVLCTAQGTDSLTFTCTTVPSNAITLSVVILG